MISDTAVANASHRPLLAAIEGGGTRFVCAVGHAPAQVLERITLATSDATTTLAACIQALQRMADSHGPIAALGLACFGPLQLRADAPDFGCMQATPKPGWSGADLLKPLRQALQVPVALDTDVGAAAYGEWQRGAGRGLGSLAYVTVGTGIGGAVVPAAAPGERLMHAEMGHMTVRRDPRDQGFDGVCPFHGDCLEGMASGPAIRARFGGDLATLPANHPGRSLIAGYLSQLACNIALLHAVERVVFGGGVMRDGSLLSPIRAASHAYLNGYLQPLRERSQMDTFLSLPELGEGAAIAGALLQAQSLLAE